MLRVSDDSVESLDISHDGNFLVTGSGSADGTVKIWNVEEQRCIKQLEGHHAKVYGVAFSPYSRYVVSGADDNKVKLWDCITGRCVKTMSHELEEDTKEVEQGFEFEGIRVAKAKEKAIRWVLGVAFSPDGRKIASASADKTIKIWSFNNPELV